MGQRRYSKVIYGPKDRIYITAIEEEVQEILEFNPDFTIQQIHERTKYPFKAIEGAIQGLQRKGLLEK